MLVNLETYRVNYTCKGAFHLSQLTGQTIPVTTIISLLISQISQILNSMHERESLSAKTLGKSLFHFQTDWSGNGLAGQSGQIKNGSVAGFSVVTICKSNADV